MTIHCFIVQTIKNARCIGLNEKQQTSAEMREKLSAEVRATMIDTAKESSIEHKSMKQSRVIM